MTQKHIALFGPTGGTGRAVIDQALAEGYEVTALIRTPSKLEITHDRLHLVAGDAMNYEDVQKVVAGKDVVLCCLGTRAADKTMVRAEGTRNIIRAMETEGVQRLIVQASLGYGDSAEMMPWYMTYIIIPYLLKNAFKDHALQEELIEQSNLDWVIARPASLTNGKKTESYKHGFPTSEKIKLRISRADVAHFMLAQIGSDRYVGQKVGLSY
ncbi:MAG: SDR family oxidoreductase [Bacteroidota bacterium]